MANKQSILLVEDEPLILMDLEFAVEDRGMTALSASSVRKALQLLATEPSISVAVLDITLQNGEDCLPIARELERRAIPYVLHSGELDSHTIDFGKLRGSRVAKPANAASVVTEALESASGIRANA